MLIAASLSACKRHSPATPEAANQSAASAAAPAAPAADAPAPAAPAAAATAQAPAVKPFDLQSVPVTTKTLPPFPYVATPSELNKDQVYIEKDTEFDRAYVVAGQEFRPVEGRVLHRNFFLHELKWSPLAAHRNYETALKALGGVRVDAVHPADDKFVERNGGDSNLVWKRMGIPSLNQGTDADVPGFEQWLIRTPTTNIWVSFFVHNNDGQFGLLVVEEKAMKQLVQTLPAAELSSALQKDGHVALYLNFDTDSQVIRPDSLPAVDEVVKLLQGEPDLKLRVEGHTDATGDAAHNRKLSLARAQSVVAAITAKQIAASRLSAVGKGPDQPLADNTTEEGKAKNRRVELVRA
ncbi:MAG: OmpA family protein [Gammaproteobacteria bacterium]